MLECFLWEFGNASIWSTGCGMDKEPAEEVLRHLARIVQGTIEMKHTNERSYKCAADEYAGRNMKALTELEENMVDLDVQHSGYGVLTVKGGVWGTQVVTERCGIFWEGGVSENERADGRGAGHARRDPPRLKPKSSSPVAWAATEAAWQA